MDGENIQTIFPNFSAIKTHFISNIYTLVDHGIKFYQFQSLSNLHFYKILNLEEMTTFSCASFTDAKQQRRGAEFNTIINLA